MMRLVAGVKEALSGDAVAGAKRFLFSGFVILDPEDFSATEQTIFLFHDSWKRA